MSEKLPLTFAVAEAPHTSAIRNGQISIAGVDGEFLTIHPQIAAFRRMVRDVEFDVCELAPTTYIRPGLWRALHRAADFRASQIPPFWPAVARRFGH